MQSRTVEEERGGLGQGKGVNHRGDPTGRNGMAGRKGGLSPIGERGNSLRSVGGAGG